MSSRVILMCIALVAVVAVASWLHLASAPPPDTDEPTTVAAAPRPSAASTPRMPSNAPAATTQAPRAGKVVAPSLGAGRFESEETGLVVDGNGKLVKDARTRDEIERLLSGNPDQLESSKQELIDNLPPAAAQEALELVDRFINYRAAMAQALPEQYQALTEEDALVMLNTMHDTRVAYFGQELTEAFFGAEEALGKGTAEQMLQAR